MPTLEERKKEYIEKLKSLREELKEIRGVVEEKLVPSIRALDEKVLRELNRNYHAHLREKKEKRNEQ